MSNNDTLTVESDVTVDTSAAEPVELENHTFSTSSTTITNNGTIIGTTKGIEADQSTDFSINNSGTVSVTDNANSPGSALSLLQSRGTVSIINSGTLESERADTIKLHPSYGTVTINNSGSITSSKDRTINFGQHANAGTITNSGTISGRANTLYIYSSGTDYSAGTITNSGTISATGGNGFEINNVNDVTITNTGTISATADAIYNIGENSSNGNIIINKGTISSGASNHDLIVTTSVGLQSLTNDQGGNDALKLEGYLPVNYVFLANSTTDYGKLAVDSQNGATTFSISTDSSLSAGTYASIITGVSSSRFTAGSTGTVTATNGKFNWTLTETSSGSTNWNLVVTNFDNDAPTLSSSSPSDNATQVATNANIVLLMDDSVQYQRTKTILGGRVKFIFSKCTGINPRRQIVQMDDNNLQSLRNVQRNYISLFDPPKLIPNATTKSYHFQMDDEMLAGALGAWKLGKIDGIHLSASLDPADLNNIVLEKDMIISTGTCSKPIPVETGDIVTANFGELGEISINLK